MAISERSFNSGSMRTVLRGARGEVVQKKKRKSDCHLTQCSFAPAQKERTIGASPHSPDQVMYVNWSTLYSRYTQVVGIATLER